MGITDKEILELEYLLKEEEKANARVNYIDYVAYTNHRYIKTRHMEYICGIIQNAMNEKKKMVEGIIPMRNQYLAFNLPPRHSKSMSITETLPSYYMGHFPTDKVIMAAYNTSFALRFGKKNKTKVSQFGKDLFDIELSKSTTSSETWELSNEIGRVISRGILAGITGEGADLLIIDDPIKNNEDAMSETQRDKVWNEWIDSFSTRLHPGAIVILILTRWHSDDIQGRLLNEEYAKPLPWKVTNLPLECDKTHIEEEGNPLNRKLGEPLWEERYDRDFIEERKRYPTNFNSLYQGRPTAEGGEIILEKWWKYYDELPSMVRTIISVDASFKDSDSSDFVNIQVWGKERENYYLIDMINERMNFPDTMKAIINTKKKYPKVTEILVEDKANGSAIISMLRNRIPGIIPITPKESKLARVQAVLSVIESGNCYLPKYGAFTKPFVQQCKEFPKGKNDDMVDSMSMCLNRFYYHWATIETKIKKYRGFDPLSVDEPSKTGFLEI